jgi:hypothetical protein
MYVCMYGVGHTPISVFILYGDMMTRNKLCAIKDIMNTVSCAIKRYLSFLRPRIIENRVIKIIGLIEEIGRDIFALVVEVVY